MHASERFTGRRQSGAIDGRILLAAATVIALLVVIYFLYPRAGSDAGSGEPFGIVEPPATAEERGDTARDIVARLQKDGAAADYASAYAQAGEFREEGQLADAQLLLFFAARGGYTPAALELGSAYDPAYHSSATSLSEEPDPFQAYKWYKTALEGGDPTAATRIAALRRWAEDAAQTGEPQAEMLLLQMEQAP